MAAAAGAETPRFGSGTSGRASGGPLPRACRTTAPPACSPGRSSPALVRRTPVSSSDPSPFRTHSPLPGIRAAPGGGSSGRGKYSGRPGGRRRARRARHRRPAVIARPLSPARRHRRPATTTWPSPPFARRHRLAVPARPSPPGRHRVAVTAARSSSPATHPGRHRLDVAAWPLPSARHPDGLPRLLSVPFGRVGGTFVTLAPPVPEPKAGCCSGTLWSSF